FLQAEDGIRVFHVTGVQTCALPIFTMVISPCMRTTSSWVGRTLPVRTDRQNRAINALLASRSGFSDIQVLYFAPKWCINVKLVPFYPAICLKNNLTGAGFLSLKCSIFVIYLA